MPEKLFRFLRNAPPACVHGSARVRASAPARAKDACWRLHFLPPKLPAFLSPSKFGTNWRSVHASNFRCQMKASPQRHRGTEKFDLSEPSSQAVILSEGGLPRALSSAGKPSRRIWVLLFASNPQAAKRRHLDSPARQCWVRDATQPSREA